MGGAVRGAGGLFIKTCWVFIWVMGWHLSLSCCCLPSHPSTFLGVDLSSRGEWNGGTSMMVKDCFMSSDGSCAVVASEMSVFYGGRGADVFTCWCGLSFDLMYCREFSSVFHESSNGGT